MRVALVGPPLSGKSTLFAAVAEAGGTQVHLDRPDQPHLVVVKVPDGRLFWLEEKYKAKKRTHAEIELLDLPGFDLTSPQSRDRARTHWPACKSSDVRASGLSAASTRSGSGWTGCWNVAGTTESGARDEG